MTSPFEEGQRVLARWSGNIYWFTGTVYWPHGGGNLIVIDFDDQSRQHILADQVKPLDWTVGTSIECAWPKPGNWVDATIVEFEPGLRRLKAQFGDGTIRSVLTEHCRAPVGD